MKVVSTAEMRELERRAMAEWKVPGRVLMDRAGLGLADFIDELHGARDYVDRAIRLIAGRGNNGGDIFAAAYHLSRLNYTVEVWLAGALADVRGDALTHLSRLKAKRLRVRALPTADEWEDEIALVRRHGASDPPIVVDGVLGTGLKGPARGPSGSAIRWINAQSAYSLVVAADVPSGLDSDTGCAEGDAVRADYTVTMGLPKRGLVEPAAADHVGRLAVVSLGLPDDFPEKAEAGLDLIVQDDLRPLFPRRPRAAHKGAFGRLLIVGGAAGYAGAAGLAVRAALRSGAGLVTAVVPRSIAPVVAGLAPEAMVHGAPETEAGSLAAAGWPEWAGRLRDFSAVAAGPGMTRHPETAEWIGRLLAECRAPLALDADALNAYAGRLDALADRQCPLVITPHPGEMARLLGIGADAVQARRFDMARDAAARARAAVVLKGAGTLVAEADRPLAVNMAGNPGMAAGGMGDVLTGLLGGLLAQGLEPYDAARAAVFLHGRAGDRAAVFKSEAGLTAGDLILELPGAFDELSPR